MTLPGREAARPPGTGVLNAERLRRVSEAELEGHLGDPDLNAVVATLRIACDVPMAVVNIVWQNRQVYPAEVGVGAPCSLVPDALSFCAEVVETGQPLDVSDARQHPVYADNPLVREGVITSYAGVPLVDNGYVLGTVSIFGDKPGGFSPQELEVLLHQGRLASSVLALRRSARTDLLTGLPNRAGLRERLDRALSRLHRHQGHVGVLFVDADDFKSLNDRYGHGVGDLVLVELARRLTEVMRPNDTLLRLGGDEFVVVCEDLTAPGDADLVAARMLMATSGTWAVAGQQLGLDLSIGVAVTDSSLALPNDLLRLADSAMYVAKQTPGASWHHGAAPTRLAAG